MAPPLPSPPPLLVAEFKEVTYRLLDLFRQRRPLTRAEQQLIDSLLCVLRMEWDYWKAWQEDQARVDKGRPSVE